MTEGEAQHRTMRVRPQRMPGIVDRLWLGLLFMIISFGVKQVLVDWSMWNLAGTLDEPRLDAERRAEMYKAEREGGRSSRRAIDEKYSRLREEIRGKSYDEGASALRKMQWYLYLKVVLDALRLVGAVMVLSAALRISMDETIGTWTKAYAVVCAAAALVSIVFGGLLTLLG